MSITLVSPIDQQSLEPQIRRILTVPQFCQRHPAFTPGGIRWLLFHRTTNGLDHAVVRLGRRILLDEDKFFQWLDRQQNGARYEQKH
jgi:hypothetical protein